jgi:DNA polymerase III subunit delta
MGGSMGTYDRANDRAMGRVNGKLAIGFDDRFGCNVQFWVSVFGRGRMAVYFYWGEDSFARDRAVQLLQAKTLDEAWASFNLDKIGPDQTNGVIHALNQAMTPPFGMGGRFILLSNTTLGQRCSEELLAELDRTLSVIPDTSTLVFTSDSKPDGRLKSTKLLQKHAKVQEFSPIPPWKGDQLAQQVRDVAGIIGVKLDRSAVEYLVEAVGNNTRQLHNELEKIRLFAASLGTPGALTAETIAPLITTTSQNTLKLFAAIRQGKTAEALDMLSDLVRQNEPSPVIARTLVGQFRQYLWVKLMIESGERDDGTIAAAAEIKNPKQLYFLRKDIAPMSLAALQKTLPLLMELEYQLKRTSDEVSVLQIKTIELCALFSR